MNFVSCFNPKIITNPYTGEKIPVVCGKCAPCINAKGFEKVSRLRYEGTFHRYEIFFTLTYAPKYLPKATRLVDDDGCEFVLFDNDKNPFSYDNETLNLSEQIRGSFYDTAFRSRLASKNVFSCSSKRDVQLFTKRVRKTISRLFGDFDKYGDETKIRFFVVSEYGKKQLRVHYHGLFWFESRQVYSRIREIISSCWPYGRVDAQLSRNRAASYVSKYIVSASICPPLYSFGQFKPFVLSSRRPAIGVPFRFNEALRKKVLDCDFTDIIEQSQKLSLVTVPRAYSNRLYPKCRQFSKRSLSGKYVCYACSFVYDVKRHYFPEWWRNVDDSIKRDYYISKRACNNAASLGLTLWQYVQLIDNYYSKYELYLLKQFYEFQQNFAARHPEDTLRLVALYPVLLSQVRDWLRDGQRTELKMYNILSTFAPLPPLEELPFQYFNEIMFDPFITEEVSSYIHLQNKIKRDSVRTKLHNDNYNLLDYEYLQSNY